MKINKLNYVDEAERVIERLAQNAKKDKLGHPMFLLTTSKNPQPAIYGFRIADRCATLLRKRIG